MQKHIHILVTGRVQGIAFRANTRLEAERLGLFGFVRNLPDGSVEIDVQGPQEAVEEMCTWAKRGPRAARIDTCQVQDLSLDDNLTDFRVLR